MHGLPIPALDSPRVFCDFNAWDEPDCFPLDGSGTLRDLEEHGIELQEGMVLTFYMMDADTSGNRDDLLATGVVRWNSLRNRWEANIDRATMLQESELRKSSQ